MSIPRTLQLQNPPLRGADVDQLQVWLGMNESDGTGRLFGGQTHQAVKNFKAAHKLRKDGTVNDLTWNVIQMIHRNASAPRNLDYFHVSGRVELLDLKTNTTQPAIGYAVRVFAADNNAGIDPRRSIVLGEDSTNNQGDYAIQFRWTAPPPPPPLPGPPPVPAPPTPFLVDVGICIGDMVVGHPQLKGAGLVDYVYHTLPPLPEPGYGPPDVLALMSLPLNLISGQFLHRTNPVGVGKQVSAEAIKLFYYLIENGLLKEHEYVPAQAPHASPPPTAATYHFSYEWPPAGVTEPVPDLRVRAYRGGNVVGETPIIFNARKIEDDVNIDLPDNGVTEVPELNRPPGKSDFEILCTEIQAAADVADLVVMAGLLGKASSNEREATVRYIAGDLVIDRAADPPPTDDGDRAAYEQNTQQKITQKAGPVDRTLRACEMQGFSADRYPALPGAVVRDLKHSPVRFIIPVGPGINRNLSLLVSKMDPIPARYFFALLSSTPASVATSGLYDAAVMRSTDSQRETILMAHKNRVIDILPVAGNPTEPQLLAEMGPVLVKLAALRDTVHPQLPWSVVWSATTPAADEKAVLNGLMADSGSWAALEAAHPNACIELRWSALTFGKELLEAQLRAQTYPARDLQSVITVNVITDLLDVADEDGGAVKGLRQHLRDGCAAADPVSNIQVYLTLPERIDNLPIRGSDVNSTAENLRSFVRTYLPLPRSRVMTPTIPVNASPSSHELVAFFQLAPEFSFTKSNIADYDSVITKACRSDQARAQLLRLKLSVVQILGDLALPEAARNWLAEKLEPLGDDVCRSFHAMPTAQIATAGTEAQAVTAAQTMLNDLWTLVPDRAELGPAIALLLRRGWNTYQIIRSGPPEDEYMAAFPSNLRSTATEIRQAAIAHP